MAANTQNTAPTLTAEQMAEIRKQADDFEQKSVELASTSAALSAHYWRLFQACKPSLKRFARMELTLRNKAAAEKRKNARNGKASAAEPTAANPRRGAQN